jgi:DNA-binding phage protein
MPLTRKFADTVVSRAQQDPEFKIALFEESLQAFFDGDFAGSKEMLRYCINETAGFQMVSEKSGIPVKSLMRMVGPNGNPRLENFSSLIKALRDEIYGPAVITLSVHDDVSVVVTHSSTAAMPPQIQPATP